MGASGPRGGAGRLSGEDAAPDVSLLPVGRVLGKPARPGLAPGASADDLRPVCPASVAGAAPLSGPQRSWRSFGTRVATAGPDRCAAGRSSSRLLPAPT